MIQLKPDVDPQTPIGELFAGGPIEISILGRQGAQTRVGINADARFLILRDELEGE